jgi:hypothetical protein
MASPLASDMELTQAGFSRPAWDNPKTTGGNFTMLKNKRQEANPGENTGVRPRIQEVSGLL